MTLLDTNVLSELTRSSPSAPVIAWLEANRPLIAVPTIALAELRYGISRLPTGRRRSSLLRFWEMTCEQFRGRIFSFEERAAAVYGDIAAEAEHRGRRLNVADGKIAAIALVHGMQVATRDVSDFESSGVSLVNPRGLSACFRITRGN